MSAKYRHFCLGLNVLTRVMISTTYAISVLKNEHIFKFIHMTSTRQMLSFSVIVTETDFILYPHARSCVSWSVVY